MIILGSGLRPRRPRPPPPSFGAAQVRRTGQQGMGSFWPDEDFQAPDRKGACPPTNKNHQTRQKIIDVSRETPDATTKPKVLRLNQLNHMTIAIPTTSLLSSISSLLLLSFMLSLSERNYYYYYYV